MKTITSVSGGKTSAMMACEFPTDYYVFAAVLIDHELSAPKDKGLLRECQNRIPHFVASLEADLTLLNMLKLEQKIGKRIDWVASEFTLDKFIDQTTDTPRYRSKHPMLPNFQNRFCTIETKLKPIFWHCYLNYFDGDPFLMNIGFRFDEPKRVNGWTCDKDKFKFPVSCGLEGSKRWKYSTVDYRVTQFPMYQHGITKSDVIKYWDNLKVEYPQVSNCRFCFHHQDFEQKIQAELESDNLKWWLEQEAKTGYTFGKRSLLEILSNPSTSKSFTTTSCSCTD